MYYHPDSTQTRAPLIVSTLFGGLALLSLVGRFYAIRILRSAHLRIEEWLIAAALVLTYVSLGIQWACVVRGGTGRHMADVVAGSAGGAADVVLTLKLILPFEALYGITLMLIKFSVLIFYERTFVLSARWFQLSLRITGVVVFLWMVSVILETFLLCRPLAFNWDPTIPHGVCGDRNAVYVVAGVTNMVTDFMVLLVPIPAIWKLKMAIGQKIGLIAIFSMGIFITAISIVRLKSLMVISFTDPTYTLPMGLLWTVLEPELAIINANLPFLRRFLAQIIPRAFSSVSRSSRGANAAYPSKNSRRGGGRLDFDKIPDNAVVLQTIGGGYIHTSRVAAAEQSSQTQLSSSYKDNKSIVQQRSYKSSSR